MSKVEHVTETKKVYVLAVIVVFLFSALLVGFLFMIDVADDGMRLDSFFVLALKMGVTATFVFIITRPENQEMFQPYTYNEVEHKVKGDNK